MVFILPVDAADSSDALELYYSGTILFQKLSFMFSKESIVNMIQEMKRGKIINVYLVFFQLL